MNNSSTKLTAKGAVVLTSLLFSATVWSANLGPFKKRFEFVRNNAGEVQLVRDSSIKMKFSIRPYLQFIKESLIQEQALMKQKADYDGAVRELFADPNNESLLGYQGAKGNGDAQIIVDSLRTLEGVDFEKVFSDRKFQDVMGQYESKLSQALLKLDPTVMANLVDQDFFYQKRVTYQVLNWGLNFAKKRLSQVPVLNTASYVLVRVEELVRNRRLYHQNMLLHYLEKVPSGELGLKEIEVNHIMSSIYESRIAWFAFWESRSAKANWDKFGVNKFFTEMRFSNNRFRRLGPTFDGIGNRLNYAFQEVTQEGENVILNLYSTKNMFSSDLDVAYNLDQPKKVLRKRMVVQLAELGLSFVPLPSFIKGIAEDYMKSMYKEQSLIEGALYGHFEANQDTEMMNRLKIQVLNPFETL